MKSIHLVQVGLGYHHTFIQLKDKLC